MIRCAIAVSALALVATLPAVPAMADDAKTVAAIERIAVNIGKAHGLPDDLPVTMKITGGNPVTANDPPLARRLNAVMQRELGAAAFEPFEQKNMGARDFASLK